MILRKLAGVQKLGLAAWLSALITLVACGQQGPAPLKIGMVPDAGASQMSVEEKAPLRQYLAERLGRPVELVIPTNYNAAVEGIGNGSLDIAYFGGLTYAKARARYDVIPLVQRDIDLQFHSLFIAHSDSRIDSLADLRGKNFCFGDINSTSGHLIPRLLLKRAGLDPDRDFASFRYSGSHPATAQAVATGACDAGALDETVFKSLVDEGKLSTGAVKIFLTSPPFADYVWAARKDLAAQDRDAFSQALLALRPGKDDAILDVLRGEKFVPAEDDAYRDIARIGKELGLL